MEPNGVAPVCSSVARVVAYHLCQRLITVSNLFAWRTYAAHPVSALFGEEDVVRGLGSVTVAEIGGLPSDNYICLPPPRSVRPI